jgi:hypothetical protein
MSKNRDIKSAVPKVRYPPSEKPCPHMLRPDRCGLCLREKHYKEMYGGLAEEETRGPMPVETLDVSGYG